MLMVLPELGSLKDPLANLKRRVKMGLATPKDDDVVGDDEPLPYLAEDDLELGVFPRDSAWGNRIVWDEFDDGYGRVHGWKEVPIEGPEGRHHWRPVRDGDRFGYEMEDGYVAVFELGDVENERDPRDMFFADARAVAILEGTDGE